MKIILLWTK